MTKSTVAVIDYGMGNLHSAAKALEHVAPAAQVLVTPDADTILSADRVVFPGVGAIRDCVGEIRRLGLDEVVREAAKSKPLLGICVGMQSMMSHSEENGGVDCLDLFPGEVKFFGDSLKDANGVEHPNSEEIFTNAAGRSVGGIPELTPEERRRTAEMVAGFL